MAGCQMGKSLTLNLKIATTFTIKTMIINVQKGLVNKLLEVSVECK